MIDSHRVAIQGELGSNSAQAAYDYFSDRIDLIPCTDFEGLFAAIENGSVDYGMAPVENSIAGSIFPVWDLLTQNTPTIIGEHYLLVRHNLIGHPDTPLEKIQSAHSHEQALTQCAKYLLKMNIKPVSEYDTAGAVALIKERGIKSEAAIAPLASAQIHKMQVLAKDIQTNSHNYTRFLIVCNKQVELENDHLKQTMIIDLPMSAKSLGQILKKLSDHDLTKVETRKLADFPWMYRCYVEFIKPSDVTIQEDIRDFCEKITLLTPYPVAPHP